MPIDNRNLGAGTKLVAKYKGQQYVCRFNGDSMTGTASQSVAGPTAQSRQAQTVSFTGKRLAAEAPKFPPVGGPAVAVSVRYTLLQPDVSPPQLVTRMLSEATLPTPPSLETTAAVDTVFAPGLVADTVITKVQVDPGARVALVRLMD